MLTEHHFIVVKDLVEGSTFVDSFPNFRVLGRIAGNLGQGWDRLNIMMDRAKGRRAVAFVRVVSVAVVGLHSSKAILFSLWK